MWCFVSTGRAGEYKLYNAGQKGFLYKDGNYLKVPSKDYAPVKVVYDTENSGLLMSVDDEFVNVSNTTIQLDIEAQSYWRVQIALIENNKEVADIITIIESVIPEAASDAAIYDLNGRRVVNPTRGIFIQNGKKVLVK